MEIAIWAFVSYSLMGFVTGFICGVSFSLGCKDRITGDQEIAMLKIGIIWPISLPLVLSGS